MGAAPDLLTRRPNSLIPEVNARRERRHSQCLHLRIGLVARPQIDRPALVVEAAFVVEAAAGRGDVELLRRREVQ